MIEIQADIGEAMDMLTRIMGVVNPQGLFAREVPKLLDHKMHQQQEEKFASEGDGEWAQLSDWRTRDRGTSHPILDDTGSFKSTVSSYVGMWSATPDAFSYIYPSLFMAEAGKYFGITAGQRRNPLAKKRGTQGPAPQPPRPILFGEQRMASDVRMVLAEFMASAGFIGAGITGYAGE